MSMTLEAIQVRIENTKTVPPVGPEVQGEATMSQVLTALHADHVNLARLLEALEHQLAVFDAGEAPDYEIVSGILDYCLGYQDRFHHPKEDAILVALERREPEAAANLRILGEEHEKLAALTRQFADVVQQILQDQEVRRDWLDENARNFLEFYRHHLEWEESEFFPKALEALSEDDWNAIDARFAAADPLFGAETEARFERLAEELLSLDGESREA